MPIISVEKLNNANLDAETIEQVVNGEPNVLVESRKRRKIPTLATLGEKYLSAGVILYGEKTQEQVNDEVGSALTGLSFANKTYATVAAANADIANIAVNQSVWVSSATDGGLYEKATAGATSLTKSAFDPLTQAVKAANEHLDKHVSKALTKTVHPIIVDSAGQVPLWLNKGKLGFSELEPETKKRVQHQFGLEETASLNIYPIAVDPSGKIPLWVHHGKLNFAGIHPNAVKLIKEQIGNINQQKNNNVTGAAYPIVSDGASLIQWKAKASKIKSGLTQQIRLLITGDSWAEHKTITNEILPIVRTEYGEAGSGWINLGVENNQLDNISVSKSGTWDYRDLDAATTFPHGSGPDGFILTSTAAGDKLTVSNLSKGDKLTVFYGKADEAFKYSINGGAETTITSSASGSTVQSTTIDVSANSNIVFTTLSGTVVLFGLHLRKSTGSGVEVTKVGNGNATGFDYSKISPTAQADFNNYLKPDLVIIILGTNDYRHGRTVASFKAGILAMINGYRTNNPNCGFILIAPARSNASSSIPLSDFRDAIYEIAQEQKCEFYNMYDDWGQHSFESANGMWNDSLHVSKSGAYRIAKKLFKNFLEI